MLITQQEQHSILPQRIVYDSAAGPGKLRREVNETTYDHTQIIAPLHGAGRRSSEFGPEDFILSLDGSALTCPNGNTTHVVYHSDSGDGRQFRFRGKQCQGCPLWTQCRSPKQPPTSKCMRQVFISDYRPEVEAARRFNATEEYTLAMKQRPGVERIIAGIVRYNGGRRATRRGIDTADFQAKMNSTAFNLKTWVRLLAQRARQQALAAKIPVAT